MISNFSVPTSLMGDIVAQSVAFFSSSSTLFYILLVAGFIFAMYIMRRLVENFYETNSFDDEDEW